MRLRTNPRRSRCSKGRFAILLAAAAMLAHSSPAFAAAPIQPDGRLSGYVAGVTLLLLVGYSVFVCTRPALDQQPSGLGMALLVLAAIWMIKQSVLPLLPGYGGDVGSYMAWATQMVSDGPARMYRPGYFLDYPPGYLYALWAVGAIANLTGAAGEALRELVEAPALLADLLMGLVMFAYLRRRGRPLIAWAGMLLVALNPAMLYDSVAWGQSDAVPALVTLLSALTALDDEYELAWALAALGVLIKPQVLLFVPVLGLWTLFTTGYRRWLQAALALAATAIIAVAPFQIGHPWNWLYSLYRSTAGYYHETSVNAFNLMALLYGLRNGDDTAILGVPCFALGMALLVPLYGFAAWVLWRKRSATDLMFCAFIALFGSFMLAPRMHERYLYPALIFAVPLALEDPLMLAVLGVMSATCLFNLAYIKHVLDQPSPFLDGRDLLSMVASAINTVIFGLAVFYGFAPAKEEGGRRIEAGIASFAATLRSARASAEPVSSGEEPAAPPMSWMRADTIIIAVLIACAIVTRFWRLGHPAEIVFDEVHFVGQARHYLRSEPFLDPHPPLGKLLIALGILLHGDHPLSWRFPNAIVGTILVGVTYLLGRRMLHSRLAATLAAGFILCDGMFLVDSRIAVLDIVYVTCAAWAYLLLFRFYETSDLLARRRLLVWMGLALGLCLGAKLMIPAVTFLLVIGFLVYALLRTGPGTIREAIFETMRMRRVGSAVLLTGSIAAMVYLAVFFPHYLLGWWGGMQDLFKYFSDVIWYEQSVYQASHPYASRWWSWPLMLRPVAYWQNFPATGKVSTIWGGGNPASWWGALTAITIIGLQAVERPRAWRWFLVIGYVAYIVIWIPVGRTLFLYHYMGSVYLAYFALAAVLTQCWEGGAQPWEHSALILTLLPVLVLGLPAGVGFVGFLLLCAAYGAVLYWRPQYAGKLVCGAFVATVIVLFFYFLPVWIAFPIDRAGYYARMWLSGPGIRNWI